jgi:hypothetical protein
MSSNAAMSLQIDPASARALSDALGKLAVQIQDKVCRNAIRKFNKDVMSATASATPSASGASRQGVTQKVKLFDGIAWGSVGFKASGRKSQSVEGGRARHRDYDSEGVGWRTHFTELGYHSWPKGRKAPKQGLGRGWKKGVKHRGQGQYHAGTFASIRAQRVLAPKLLAYLNAEIAKVTK